jgi:hypothetical protein
LLQNYNIFLTYARDEQINLRKYKKKESVPQVTANTASPTNKKNANTLAQVKKKQYFCKRKSLGDGKTSEYHSAGRVQGSAAACVLCAV